jgi:hypothetical protein
LGFDGIGAHAEDGDAELVEFFFCVTKLGRFYRSTGGVGFGVEEEDDALAVEIFQGELFAFVRLKTEIWGFSAWFQHLITLPKQLE